MHVLLGESKSVPERRRDLSHTAKPHPGPMSRQEVLQGTIDTSGAANQLKSSIQTLQWSWGICSSTEQNGAVPVETDLNKGVHSQLEFFTRAGKLFWK